LCKGKLVATDVDVVCSKCGIVVDEKIVDDSRDYENRDGSGGRVGPPTNQMWKINENSSVISQTGKDASGHRITGENRALVKRISMWDKRAKSSGVKTRNTANSKITRISEILHISEQVKQRGAEIFRECEKCKMLAGRISTTFSAACLYASCRENGISKTLTEFAEVSFARKSDLGAYYRIIIWELDIKPKVMSPTSYLSRIATNAVPPLSVTVQKQAMELLESHKDKAGKDPMGFAAAALYYVAKLKNLKHSQRVLSMAAGITEVTIRNRVDDLREFDQARCGKGAIQVGRCI
jgi:transcription initiation factor TFIIB